MMNRLVLVFGIILVTLALLTAALYASPAAAVTEIVVNTDADNATAGDTFCTLREAIINANNDSDATGGDCLAGSGPDTITFAGNYTINLSSALPEISDDLTISGNGPAGTIVQASTCDPVTLPGGCTPADYRVFTIIGGSIGLNDMNIRHGNCPGAGGACSQNSGRGGSIWNGAVLILDNVAVQSSKVISEGGGIYNDGGELSLQNGSLIAMNQASLNGGGIESNNSLQIIESTLSHNTAEYGGGVHNAGGVVTVTAGTVLSNTAFYGGGGIYNNNGLLTVQEGSLIDSNDAQGEGGGGILFDGDDPGEKTTVSHSTISKNTSTGYYGAGIYASNDGDSDGVLFIEYSTISGNVNYDQDGGGVVTYGPAMTITHSAIVDNISLGSGDAGVGAWGPSTIINTTISGNMAPKAINSQDGAGGLGVYDATVNLHYVTITNNSGGYSGGISDWDRALSILNVYSSIIAGNTGASAPDCHFSTGTLDFQGVASILEDTTGCTSSTNNGSVLMVNPLLGPLANNGGETVTHALLPGSPAIDAITSGAGCGIVATDQRGVGRPQGAGCDIGAFEVEGISNLSATNDGPTVLGQTTTLSATVQAGDDISYTWTLGDGAMDSGPAVTHNYPAVGIYTAVVTASNAVSSLSTSTKVIVDESISGLTASNDGPTVVGDPTGLSATISAGSNVNYIWDFGDGEMGDGPAVTHTYPAVGMYTAVVSTTNSVSLETATTMVTITQADFPIYLPVVFKD